MPRCCHGFTLIDALISLLVLLLCLSALYKLQWSTQRHSTLMHNSHLALLAAQQQFEDWRGIVAQPRYQQLTSGQDQITVAQRNLRFDREWQVTENPQADYKHITLHIRWQHYGQPFNISLTTIISRPPN